MKTEKTCRPSPGHTLEWPSLLSVRQVGHLHLSLGIFPSYPRILENILSAFITVSLQTIPFPDVLFISDLYPVTQVLVTLFFISVQ